MSFGDIEKMFSGKAIADFVAKIYTILEKKQYNKIICWSQDGKQIQIKNTARLQEEVLPNFFRHAKLGSFIRQLNMYGFSKKNRLTHRNSIFFFHLDFKRGDVQSLRLIKRRKRGDKSEKKDDDSEDNSFGAKANGHQNGDIAQLGQELIKFHSMHPQLHYEMRGIMELVEKITGNVGTSDGFPEAPSRKAIQMSSRCLLKTIREVPLRRFSKSNCSFGEYADDI